MAKKIIKCTHCVYLNNKNCTHTTNKGTHIKYRQANTFFIKSPDELNKNGNCKNYVELS